ncbi:biotin carboxylase N-terminal domain-containing protein [Micrococcus lylae]|uniref:ATP-binding protein n=1 Tax=Micrococcus lylae TaxID=1273 RepID=UPI002542F61B|nr:biotin carboxylase N-terminal domain-containing protein [Micrococcus lylae]WIK82475.1 biotin carboxylase N-terminal domain-containing protein [Micrococcus lylae]
MPVSEKLFDTVLVANRGEIAVRVITTLQRLGIRAVAVYSDADADAAHVRLADEAVRLGPAPARESYLDIDAVVAACRATGAQAVHPGYGFLSENADFARALDAAGVVFIGPPVSSLDAMADKIRAKETVSAYGVPVVPGIADPTLTDEQIIARVDEVGFPLLIKPSAGGGGKGMFAVHSKHELPGALASARRTASNAFGDDTLLLERLITSPRHIEVQVFADSLGTTVHLAERECSLQRRHQKVIEEAPAPLLTAHADGEALRARLGDAAVQAATSVGYVGAGTVEFLVSDDNPDEFFFMEMNTRLQVEHPVSEEVVRVRGEQQDFVELQVRVAAGEPLGFVQEDVTVEGAAVEARVYAEDPANGFLPSTGQVLTFVAPQGEGVRVDSLMHVEDPDSQPEVIGFYDPMIAKVITRGADRAEAMERLDAALKDTVLTGVTSNLAWLRHLAALPEVRQGRLTTTMIHGMDEWSAPELDADTLAAAAGALAEVDVDTAHEGAARQTFARPRGGHGAWAAGDAWRSVGAPAPTLSVEVDGVRHSISPVPVVAEEADEHGAATDAPEPAVDAAEILVHPADPRTAWVRRDGFTWRVHRQTRAERLESARSAAAARLVPEGAGSPEARTPMPGTVVAVHVATGDRVEAGEHLADVEAMKMEHPITAALAGTVTVHVSQGDSVPAQGLVATVEPDAAEAPAQDA